MPVKDHFVGIQSRFYSLLSKCHGALAWCGKRNEQPVCQDAYGIRITREIKSMKAKQRVRKSLKWSVGFGTLIFGVAFMQQANAGCLDMSGFMKKTGYVGNSAGVQGAFIKAGYERDEEWAPGFFHAPIVGLWSFKYIAEGNGANGPPDGTAVDGGNTLWFADGNEITYSAIRNPTTGATCLGIWKQTGKHTYELNHIGVSWDSAFTGPFGGSSGPAFIRQSIKLAPDEMSYTGTFEISQLETDGKTLVPGFPIKGKIKANRVTMSTTTQTLPQSGNEKP